MEGAILPYNDTQGYVSRQASRERAVEEALSGTAEHRQRMVMGFLGSAGQRGATWKEVGTALNLHHGQVSGCLSVLHGAGRVFMLRSKRDKCHPYVSASFKSMFTDAERFDEPTRTRSGNMNERLARASEIVNTMQALSAMYAEKCGNSEDKVVFCLLEEALSDALELMKVGKVG